MATFTFHVPSIICSGCANNIEKNLRQQLAAGVAVSVDAEAKVVEVTGDEVDSQFVIQWLKNLGHTVGEVASDQMAQANYFLIRGVVCATLGLPLLGLSIAAVPLSFPVIVGVAAVSSLVCLYAGFDIYRRAFKSLFYTGSITIDLLFALSTFVAIGTSIASFFVPLFHFEFAMALLIFACRHIGKYIESTVKAKVVAKPGLCEDLPKTANKVAGNSIFLQNINEFKLGEIVRVAAGEVIPFDGVVIAGNAEILRTVIDGQKLPGPVKQSEYLYAGMVVDQGFVDVKIEKNQDNCYLKERDQALNNSRKQKVSMEKTTNEIIQYFVPGVLAVTAISTAVAVPLWGINFAMHVALGLLAGACPCALGYTVPLAVKTGVNRNAELGLLVNQPEAMQTAANVETVVFDLNGTLTEGRPAISNFNLVDSTLDRVETLNLLGQMQSALQYKNIIGAALLQYAQQESKECKTEYEIEIISDQNQPGFSARVDGEEYHVGNAVMMRAHGVEAKENVARRVYLAKGNTLVASIDYADRLRGEAVAVVGQLQALNKKIVICTGADQATANSFAKQLGVNEDNVFAEVSGDEAKQAVIENKLAVKNTMFVGDGVNDAAALKTAAVGVAMYGAGSAVVAQADVEVTQDSLCGLTQFFKVGDTVASVIKQNLGFTFFYNLSAVFVCIGLTTALGMAAPAVMALCMTVQSLLILANTARISYAAYGNQVLTCDTPDNDAVTLACHPGRARL